MARLSGPQKIQLNRCDGWRIVVRLIHPAAQEIRALVVVFRWIDQCAIEAGDFFFFVRQAEGSFEGWSDAAQCEGAPFINGSAQEAKAA